MLNHFHQKLAAFTMSTLACTSIYAGSATDFINHLANCSSSSNSYTYSPANGVDISATNSKDGSSTCTVTIKSQMPAFAPPPRSSDSNAAPIVAANFDSSPAAPLICKLTKNQIDQMMHLSPQTIAALNKFETNKTPLSKEIMQTAFMPIFDCMEADFQVKKQIATAAAEAAAKSAAPAQVIEGPLPEAPTPIIGGTTAPADTTPQRSYADQLQ